MHLTPAQCAAVYDCLREFRPFNRWHLPPASAVKFRLVQRIDIYAQYVHAPGHAIEHIVTMSSAKIGHLNTLVRCMGHEMIHAAQAISGDESRAQHNADFNRRARLVANHLGWDAKEL